MISLQIWKLDLQQFVSNPFIAYLQPLTDIPLIPLKKNLWSRVASEIFVVSAHSGIDGDADEKSSDFLQPDLFKRISANSY